MDKETYTPKELLHDILFAIVFLSLVYTVVQNNHLKQHNQHLQRQSDQQQEQLNEINTVLNQWLGEMYDE